MFTPIPAQEREALLASLGPLPLSGPAWPGWVKGAGWAIVALLGLQIIVTAARVPPQSLDAVSAGVVVFGFVGLAVVARAMQKSVTTISADGLSQTWLTRRQVAWDEIHYAKFVPMLFSKRLIVFRRRGRPLVLQAGTPELQAAFARIALAYRRR